MGATQEQETRGTADTADVPEDNTLKQDPIGENETVVGTLPAYLVPLDRARFGLLARMDEINNRTEDLVNTHNEEHRRGAEPDNCLEIREQALKASREIVALEIAVRHINRGLLGLLGLEFPELKDKSHTGIREGDQVVWVKEDKDDDALAGFPDELRQVLDQALKDSRARASQHPAFASMFGEGAVIIDFTPEGHDSRRNGNGNGHGEGRSILDAIFGRRRFEQ